GGGRALRPAGRGPAGARLADRPGRLLLRRAPRRRDRRVAVGRVRTRRVTDPAPAARGGRARGRPVHRCPRGARRSRCGRRRREQRRGPTPRRGVRVIATVWTRWGAAVPVPEPSEGVLRPGIEETDVAPGLVGFVVTFVLVIGCLVL